MPVSDRNSIPMAIASLAEGASDAVAEATEETHSKMMDNWDSGQDAMGRPWRPLSPVTVREKGHSSILYDTGEMKGSVKMDIDRTRLRGSVYSTSGLIPIHEYGVPENGLPRRPIMGPAGERLSREVPDAFESSIGRRLDGI